jgi:ketosteroid isomerase-like protein
MAPYDDASVASFLAPWNAHDVDGAMTLMTDDCLWEITRGSEPYGRHRQDLQGNAGH